MLQKQHVHFFRLRYLPIPCFDDFFSYNSLLLSGIFTMHHSYYKSFRVRKRKSCFYFVSNQSYSTSISFQLEKLGHDAKTNRPEQAEWSLQAKQTEKKLPNATFSDDVKIYLQVELSKPWKLVWSLFGWFTPSPPPPILWTAWHIVQI